MLLCIVVKVTWDDKLCIQAGLCVKNLPSVFQLRDGKFVIVPEGAPEARVRQVVSQCPSGALKVID